MEAKNAFQRNFLIFNTEDDRYEAGQKPSGHVRIEVRDGKGKLWSTVQNLASRDGRLIYKLYLVKAGREPSAAVCAGMYGLRQNTAELEWAFAPNNVYGSGYGISEFDVFAVLTEYTDRENTRILCPLAAYRKKGTEWRKKLDSLIYAQNKMHQKQPGNDYINPYPKPLEENMTPVKTPEAEKYYPEVENVKPEAENIYQEEENTYNEVVKSKFTPPETVPEENLNAMPNAIQYKYGIHMPVDTINTLAQDIPAPIQTQPQQAQQQPQAEAESQQQPQYYDQANQQTLPYQAPQPAVNLDSNCLYMNGNMCGMYVNAGGPSPCDNCHIHANTQNVAKEEKKGDLEKLKEMLGRNFEQNDPFQTRRSDYKWWKVSNPVNLNNILYQCNIRSPLLFNPVVMMAHFKYRHLEIGVFTDRVRKHEYVVCGVPGMHMIDKKPFGDMCKWVQVEGNRPKYGGFGYWIVYLDPATGKILSLK